MAQLPCAFTPQQPPGWRPSWFRYGTPVVLDPKYGEITLVYGPAPIPCFKSAVQDDGSAWMWLGAPWYRSMYSPLAGMLFFATSWERWILCSYLSMQWNGNRITPPRLWQSSWVGVPGHGRMSGLVADIAAPPTGTGTFELGTET